MGSATVDPRGKAASAMTASILRVLVLILVLGLLIYLSHSVSDRVMDFLARQDDGMIFKIIAIGLLAYFATMALPFMPGVEIGLALLTAFGALVAPYVWLATVLALSLSFCVGRFVPCRVTARILAALGMLRGAALVRRLGDAPPSDAASFLASRAASPVALALLRYRYLALAAAINTPGNIVLGGGGGIALAAGLSRTFHPALFILTVALATMPVPLAFLFGAR